MMLSVYVYMKVLFARQRWEHQHLHSDCPELVCIEVCNTQAELTVDTVHIARHDYTNLISHYDTHCLSNRHTESTQQESMAYTTPSDMMVLLAELLPINDTLQSSPASG